MLSRRNCWIVLLNMFRVRVTNLVHCVAIEYFTDPRQAFANADVIFFLASLPFSGESRRDLLCKNINIYIDFGKALEECAHKNCVSIVVANPANTLAYVLMTNAPSLNRKNFLALNTTDHNRARSIALKICRERCTVFVHLFI